MTIREKMNMILRYLRGCKRSFVLALGCSCLGTVFHSLTPQVIRYTVDEILVKPDATLAVLVQAAFAVLGFAVLRGITNYGQRVELAKGSERFVKNIRDEVYDHIQRLSFSWHVAHSTGDMIQRATSDVEVIRRFVCNQLVEVVRTVFLIGLYLWIMFSMNVKLASIASIFVPLICIISGVFYRKISYHFKEADEAEGALTTCAQENLTGVRVVRAFGREKYEIDRFQEKNEFFSDLWIRLGKISSIYWASGTLMTCSQILVIVLAGTWETVHGNLTLGEFLAFVTYNEALSWPVRTLGRVLSDMSKAGVSMDRVGYILKAPEEVDHPGDVELPDEGDIVFDHVTFGYGDHTVLKDVSFTIPRGTTFAILWSTGSGKSTMVHLLDRLYDLNDDQGTITIGGVDIRKIRRSDLRRKIGLVLQEPFLFSQTIRENIAATRPLAGDHEIRRAAEIACVDEAITEFRDGYETLVGERGVTLSGGQKQRVAIARTLISDAKIMIFDDSLSAVDAETDTKIRTALKENLEGITTILISHRVTTLMQADRILVLDEGRVQNIGTHAELTRCPGIYRDIYEIQMSSDDRRLLEGGDGNGRI
ncbi:MAG: ABC transporter ATP-binding protein [Firmicutes bacterium]|nr:ABC transporter ATP-binding protein [Bacillota bacterium]